MSVNTEIRAPRSTVVRPFSLFYITVTEARAITPNMVRVTFGGPDLAGFTSGGLDQRVKLFFPLAGQDVPVLPAPDDWYQAYKDMPDSVRPVMRTFTIRDHRKDDTEIDIDFAVHGDLGPASRWAGRAQVGDVLGLLGPDARHADNGGVEYRPEGADWQLIVGDDTALPAIGAIIESLPAGTPAQVFLEVATAADVQRFDTEGDVRITWLSRAQADPDQPSQLVAAVRNAQLPSGRPYAWTAGEAGMVRELRKHLVTDLGWDRKHGYFGGYWRVDTAEDAR
ncbi:siderophore-interacting protein [Actinoalloteichus hymeniacidonis]|uniref:Siderophore-interacting protein n=1 Tax=Actinoalloteichus hymeniacidonis TaxID=340345 RepID=A0AAC9MZ37_9PSEU|nr:siderophore-interacting protein [Actinoalloteichus hymeniacidonis]AOS63526.1 siderophore-interacting protein [Actinoalloteichus hymeniacidonis]MBB5908430.1 NADPH-dependent ferric siderophore reductase [Actinoalloteichus hymeniacidonis]